MVTLAYENEDVASLPSFEKKGEFCEALFCATFMVCRRIEHIMHAGNARTQVQLA